MNWLGWTLLTAGLLAVFVLWDVLFCGGKRCMEPRDRVDLLIRGKN